MSTKTSIQNPWTKFCCAINGTERSPQAKGGLKQGRMNRAENLALLKEEAFDILIIGGGATGLGAAVDGAARGYKAPDALPITF